LELSQESRNVKSAVSRELHGGGVSGLSFLNSDRRHAHNVRATRDWGEIRTLFERFWLSRSAALPRFRERGATRLLSGSTGGVAVGARCAALFIRLSSSLRR
jgi:hypothetical protein